MKQRQFVVKPNFVLFNRLNNEQIVGDLINEDEIEGKHFYVIRVGQRTLKLAKDAYTPKKVTAR
jgi:hypothetical protein